jgi:hypothetical protein
MEFVFAIPNGAKLPYKKTRGGKRYSKEAVWLLKEGLLAGVSDMFIPAARGIYHGLFIEMKANTNKPTEKQKWFINGIRPFGYAAVVTWGADQAIEATEAYMSLKSGESLTDKFNSFNRR